VNFEVRACYAKTARFCSKRCRALALSVGIHIAVKSPNRKTRPTPYEKPGYIKLAGAVRKRDNYTCQKCGRPHPKGSRNLEVHHKLPIRNGGQDVMENLETLCVPCHRKAEMKLRMEEGLPPAGRGCRPIPADPS
jgi:5-methylcytosine-specific restriction endonuclease McrA